jgi:hypothetical protein
LLFHSQSFPASLLLFQLCLPPPRVKFQKTALKLLLQPVQKKLRYSVSGAICDSVTALWQMATFRY